MSGGDLIQAYRTELAELKNEQRSIQAEGGLNDLSDANAQASLIEQLEQLRLRIESVEQRIAAFDGGR